MIPFAIDVYSKNDALMLLYLELMSVVQYANREVCKGYAYTCHRM